MDLCFFCRSLSDFPQYTSWISSWYQKTRRWDKVLLWCWCLTMTYWSWPSLALCVQEKYWLKTLHLKLELSDVGKEGRWFCWIKTVCSGKHCMKVQKVNVNLSVFLCILQSLEGRSFSNVFWVAFNTGSMLLSAESPSEGGVWTTNRWSNEAFRGAFDTFIAT